MQYTHVLNYAQRVIFFTFLAIWHTGHIYADEFNPILPEFPYPPITRPQEPDPLQGILPQRADALDYIIKTFERAPLDGEQANKIVQDAMQEYPELQLLIERLCDDEMYARAKHPTRVLFSGPSGCGKTTLAHAIASCTDMICIFIKASSVATTYQNSGAQFFELLFYTLKSHPDIDFLVIIDEISSIAKFSADDRDLQQHNIATSFWLGLDEIRNERHICVIGTDNNNLDMLPEQIKTRFKNHTFFFKQPSAHHVANFMQDCLNPLSPEQLKVHWFQRQAQEPLHSCSPEFLQRLAQQVKHLSLREIEDLIDKAKILAIRENQDPQARVLERHLQEAFAHETQSWMQKVWKKRGAYAQQLVSLRAMTLYAAITGLLHACLFRKV